MHSDFTAPVRKGVTIPSSPDGLRSADEGASLPRPGSSRFVLFLVPVALVSSGLSGVVALFFPITSLIPTTVATIFVAFMPLALSRLKLPPAVKLPITLFFLLSVVGGAFSFFTTDATFALRGLVGLLAGVATMLGVAASCFSREEAVSSRRADYVIWAILLITICASFWALRQSLLGFTARELSSIAEQGSTHLVGDEIRSSGTFAVNQEFGLFSACITPGMLTLAITSKRRRALYTVSFILLSSALLLSLTRTAIVAAVITSIVSLALNTQGRHSLSRLINSILLISGLGAAGYWALQTSSNQRVIEAFNRVSTLQDISADGSFNARTDYVWRDAMALIVEHPLGLGAGAAGPVSSRFPELAPAGDVTTDQGYLMIGVQLGWLGMLMFAWMLFALIRWLGRSTDPTARASSMALLALAIAMTASQYWSLSAPILLVGAFVGVGMSSALKPTPH